MNTILLKTAEKQFFQGFGVIKKNSIRELNLMFQVL